jgi:hypothetical protein
LIAGLIELQSSDEAADWVHKSLVVKNTLTAADSDSVEASFRERVATLEASSAAAERQIDPAKHDSVAPSGGQVFVETTDALTAAPIIVPQRPAGRRRCVAAKAIRLRDKEHCKYITTQPCVVCGRTPSEAHHVRFAQPRALGRKVSDEYTVPVCRLHHRELHRYGDEASWWVGVNVDPLAVGYGGGHAEVQRARNEFGADANPWEISRKESAACSELDALKALDKREPGASPSGCIKASRSQTPIQLTYLIVAMHLPGGPFGQGPRATLERNVRRRDMGRVFVGAQIS